MEGDTEEALFSALLKVFSFSLVPGVVGDDEDERVRCVVDFTEFFDDQHSPIVCEGVDDDIGVLA